MRQKRDPTLAPLRRLVRFLLLYGLALLVLFRVLPAVAIFVQDVYDSLDALARLTLVSSLVAVAVAWQLGHHRGRSRAQRPSCDRAGEGGES